MSKQSGHGQIKVVYLPFCEVKYCHPKIIPVRNYMYTYIYRDTSSDFRQDFHFKFVYCPNSQCEQKKRHQQDISDTMFGGTIKFFFAGNAAKKKAIAIASK